MTNFKIRYSICILILTIVSVFSALCSIQGEGAENIDIIASIPPKEKIASEMIEYYNEEKCYSSILLKSIETIEENIEEEPTLYESLTNYEISLIELTVQHEVGNFSQEYKELIAAIIRNRLESPIFPNNIYDVLLAPGQFSDGNYYGVIVDDITKEAVKNVFSYEISPHEATCYYNPVLSAPSAVQWFEYSGDITFLFEYAEESWGIVYNTRFFK